MANKDQERRSTYVQLKHFLLDAAARGVVFVRGEHLTCRVMVNMGLEAVIAGIELLKTHGVGEEVVIAFIHLLYAIPGAINGVQKGGENEHVLRAAMRIVNGEIVRHGVFGSEVEARLLDDCHVAEVDGRPRNLDPKLN